jgi:hypothetical protein
MTNCSASEVLDRLRQALHCPSDAALADALGVKPNTLATWRRRNSVPYAECIAVAVEKCVNLEWLFTGRGLSHGSRTPGAIDREFLVLAIEMFKRRYGRAFDVEEARVAALEIGGYYDTIAGRWGEIMRLDVAETGARALHFIRHEYALPDTAAQSENDSPDEAKQ